MAVSFDIDNAFNLLHWVKVQEGLKFPHVVLYLGRLSRRIPATGGFYSRIGGRSHRRLIGRKVLQGSVLVPTLIKQQTQNRQNKADTCIVS